MGMGFAPTWLRQVTPPPASQNHFNHTGSVSVVSSMMMMMMMTTTML